MSSSSKYPTQNPEPHRSRLGIPNQITTTYENYQCKKPTPLITPKKGKKLKGLQHRSLFSAVVTKNAALRFNCPLKRTEHLPGHVVQKVRSQIEDAAEFASIAKAAAGQVHLAMDVLDHDPEEIPPLNHSIIVKSHQARDVGVTYEICNNDTFETIYADYASRVDLKPEDIVLKKNNIVIKPTTTAAAARISTGDVIYVHAVTSGRNVNARVKYFYVKNTCNPPEELQVGSRLGVKLERLYLHWSALVNKPVSTFSMVHNEIHLDPDTTVAEAGIKNLDVVTVSPKC